MGVHEKLRPFICQYCTYATSSQPNLRKHIKAVHHKIRDFKCETCSFDAASKQLLVRHIKAVHEKIKGYKCEECPFEATRKGKLTEHVLVSHGVRGDQVTCDGTPDETIIVQSAIEAHSVLVE